MTPDELGSAWDGAKVICRCFSAINGKPFGRPNAGVDMTFDFPTLIAHAAKTRPLRRRHDHRLRHGVEPRCRRRPGQAGRRGRRRLFLHRGNPHRSRRSVHGTPKTPYPEFGDRVRIEMNDAQGRSIFGAIEQEVVRYVP